MKRKKIKNIISNLITFVSILAFLWLLASFVNTNICNNPFSPHYQNFANWNLFNIFF